MCACVCALGGIVQKLLHLSSPNVHIHIILIHKVYSNIHITHYIVRAELCNGCLEEFSNFTQNSLGKVRLGWVGIYLTAPF